jgi:NAD(P)H dehydrogenase (quinone)
MKIGITGATGQLGRIVVEKLKEKVAAENIVVLVRTPQKAADLGVAAVTFDYESPNAEALKGIDKLLLISGNEIGKRLEQHTKVIAAAKLAGVKQIVYTSLLRTDVSTLMLAGEHLGTEKVLAESGIPFVLLRNGWYTENYTGSLAETIASGVLIGSSGEGKVASATRADFAEAAVAVLTTEGQDGKVYELAGDEAFTMAEFAAELSKLSGKTVEYKNLPVEDYVAALKGAGVPEMWAQFYGNTNVATEKGDLFDDGHQLSKLIGHPTTPLYKVLAQTLSIV